MEDIFPYLQSPFLLDPALLTHSYPRGGNTAIVAGGATFLSIGQEYLSTSGTTAASGTVLRIGGDSCTSISVKVQNAGQTSEALLFLWL